MKETALTPHAQNLILNQKEIRERRVLLQSFPTRMQVTLTERCNLRCIMCPQSKGSWNIARHTVDEILNLFPYLQLLNLQGGEPFLSEHFEGMLDCAAQYPKLQIQINTNGILIDKKWAEKLVRAGVDITYSIDGATPEIYESIRCGARFENLLKSLESVNEARVKHKGHNRLYMNVVIMKRNYRQLEMFLDFAKRHGIGCVIYSPILHNIAPEENIFANNDAEALKYLRHARERAAARACELGITLDNRLPDANEGPADKNPAVPVLKAVKPHLCLSPWKRLNLAGDEVFFHCYCAKPLGNIRKSALLDIWNSDAAQMYRKSIIETNGNGLCPAHCRQMSMVFHDHYPKNLTPTQPFRQDFPCANP